MSQLKWFSWRTGRVKGQVSQEGVMQATCSSLITLQKWQQAIEVEQVKPLPPLVKKRSAHLRACHQWLHDWHQLIESGFDHQTAFHTMLNHAQTQEECTLNQVCIEQVEGGHPIADGLLRTFFAKEQYTIQQVHFAELSGSLETTLANLTKAYEVALKELSSLKNSLVYPLSVFGLSILLIAGLKLFIFPRFARLYSQAGAELPQLTRWILNPSQFITAHDIALMLLIFVVIIVGVIYGRLIFAHSLTLKNYLWNRSSGLGLLFLKYTRQELQVLQRCLDQGLSLKDIAINIQLNTHCPLRANIWAQNLNNIGKGKAVITLFDNLKLSKNQLSTLAIGVQTGHLSKQMNQVVTQLDALANNRRQRILKTVPHLLLALMSLLTGVLMAAMYLPLFQLGLTVG